MAIKGILFDLDNTLIDFMTMKRQSSKAAISAMIDAGLDMEKKKAIDVLFEMYQEIGIEDQTVFQKFLKKHTNKVDYKILAAGIIAYRKVRASQLVPYPHVRKTLLKLSKKGYILGVVSDAPKIQAWLRLTEMNLTDFFDFVLGFEDTGKLKPSKEPFKKALKKLNLAPEEVLFVGDNPNRDIKGAKAVGMSTVLAKYGTSESDDIADFSIMDFREIENILEKK